jgi:predicted N-acetyltransferase YhbS
MRPSGGGRPPVVESFSARRALAAFVSEPLGPHHVLDRFDSGQAVLDTWLQKSAMHAGAMRTAKTFVWHAGDDAVVAYFSLAAHLIAKEALPKKVAHGAPEAIPAILLARLALSQRLHGQGLGGELLWDALTRAIAASELAAARVVVVDALDDKAARFYAHHGFVRVPRNESRLVQKVSDVAAALGGR